MLLTLQPQESRNISVQGARFYYVDGTEKITLKLQGNGTARSYDLYPRQGVNAQERFYGIEIVNLGADALVIEFEISDSEVFDNRIPEITSIEPVGDFLPVSEVRKNIIAHYVQFTLDAAMPQPAAIFKSTVGGDPFVVTGVNVRIGKNSSNAVHIYGETGSISELVDVSVSYRASKELLSSAADVVITAAEITAGRDNSVSQAGTVFRTIQHCTDVGGTYYAVVDIDLTGREVVVDGTGNGFIVGVDAGGSAEVDDNASLRVSYYGYYL